MIGQTIGKYRIVERIGRGGMGTVYRATDDTLQRDVAIKVLNAGLNEPEIAKRFRAEAITVAQLNHPGIATVYELFEHDGQWLMVMEFVRGETLEGLTDRIGPLPPERAAEVCLHALAALAHAHSLGVVHRDLKPANLMIAETGVVKIMDFGIARVSGTEHLTSAGFMMGTPAYMAPEQVLGREIDARADLYSMGVVFYRLVTAQLPFSGETPFAVAQSQVNDVPTPIGTLRADLPPWVDQVVARALAKDPQERFQSAAAFHEVLSRCLSEGTPGAAHDSSAATELMVTPPYAMPTGSLRPQADDGPTLVAPFRPDGAMPPAGGTLVQRNILLLAAGLVVLTVIGGLIWRGRTPAMPTSAPPPAASTTASATTPSAPGTTAGTAPAGAASPVVTAPPVSPPGTSAPVPAPGPTDARKPSAPATSPAPAGPARAAAGDLVLFSDVKLLTVTGRKAKDQDVIVSLRADRISVTSKSGGTPLQSLLYARVLRATYVKAKAPKFDQALPAPPADLDMPGLIPTAHHWLALQARDTFLILRLEDSNYVKLLEDVQARARVKIIRP